MSEPAQSVLYVRLPVWKIWPGGVVYLADFIHKQRPDVRQQILDLALVKPGERLATLRRRLTEFSPDIIAFSWRNMQSFGPNSDNDALDMSLAIDHANNPLHRIRSAWKGLATVWDYAAMRIRNFGYFRLVRRLLPESRIVVGGGAVTIFGKYVAEKCPPDSVVVIGEGEEAMLSIVDGFKAPAGHYYYKDRSGQISHHPAEENFDLTRLTAVNFSYIESIFQGFREYLGGDFIGVHTKRGCPLKCDFCLYNAIEGSRQRFRDPLEVAREVYALNKVYGVKNIWFTDAQFVSTRRSVKHVDAILDEMLALGTDVNWTGYLRLNYLTKEIAQKMLATGLVSIDLSFTGTQEIIDALTMGYNLEQQMEAFWMFKDGGHTNQKIKLYMPLNAPGETIETLRATSARIRKLYEMFGRDNVMPFIFFIGIQPGTPIEKKLIASGYLKKDYNPLTYNPFTIKKLLYNPQPLGGMIAHAYLEAINTLGARTGGSDYIGRAAMEILDRKLDALEQQARAA